LPHPHFRLLVITGFLGGYTTYSTFAFESLTLWERGERGISVAYMGSSLLVGFVAVALGVALARGLTQPPVDRTVRSDAPIEKGALPPPPIPQTESEAAP
jgi:CrcB protein